MKHAVALVYLIALSTHLSLAGAEPVCNPENGHHYELLFTSFLTDWYGASSLAESQVFLGVSGHLATINSEIENNFLKAAFAPESLVGSAWVGGFQNTDSQSYSEPDGGWEWITDEPFIYSNWAIGEPNNIHEGDPNEDGIEFLFDSGAWNDLSRIANTHPDTVVEFETDAICTGADLAIGVTDEPDPTTIGSSFNYFVEIWSLGPEIAEEVSLNASLSRGAKVIQTPQPSVGSCDVISRSNTVFCDFGNLDAGETASVTIRVRASRPGFTSLSTVVEAVAPVDPNPDNNAITEVTTITKK